MSREDKSQKAYQAKIDAEHRERTLRMLRDVTKANWSKVTVGGKSIPMKRYRPEGGMPETGLIMEAHPFTIYKFLDANPTQAEPLPVYASYEAMVLDGWVVD